MKGPAATWPLAFLFAGVLAGGARAEVPRFAFSAGGSHLVVEVLDDRLVHFELTSAESAPDPAQPIPVTPQVDRTVHPGPSRLDRSGSTAGEALETPTTRFTVDAGTLCLAVTDRARGTRLTTLCPLPGEPRGVAVDPGVAEHAYGLGAQFVALGNPNGDWTGRVRTPGNEHGNRMVEFGGGTIGNVQIPVLYGLGSGGAAYGLFLDDLYAQRWDLTGAPWRVETRGQAVRGYLFAGPDLPAVRAAYLDLTGRPPVPPRKLFGLWVSEWGFDDWAELEGKLASLRAGRFPVDGFVLDLPWFGGVVRNAEDSPMGRMTWDPEHFPDARARLARYRERDGVGVMPIEEAYVARGLPEHADLAARGFLVRAGCADCPPVYLDGESDINTGNWWGRGGMIDWTLDAAADYWHDAKRQPLVEDGVLGHWVDLGEPEMYDAIDSPGDPADWAQGVLPGGHAHADWHNAYNLKWAEGVARGYRRHAVARRPFVLSRTGTAGIQRHGVAMTSGDIASNLESLATHLNAQMHMSLSGVDYFGSDVGGFLRRGLDGEALDDLYTRWFATSAFLDVPLRPHTENLCNCKETAPDRVGERASNLANLRERVALTPYLYSLAHRAWRHGEPVAPPLLFHYPDDPRVREMGDQKLVGRDLLVATLTEPKATHRDVYLPAGTWVDGWTGEWVESKGETFRARPLRHAGVLRPPLFARAGAVVPRMAVDGETLNVEGRRADGSRRDELIVRVYAAPDATRFTLYEDDGETVAYQQGTVRETDLGQQLAADRRQATVTVAPARGTYDGAPARRDNRVELFVDRARVSRVSLNGVELPPREDLAALDAAPDGWARTGEGQVVARSGVRPVGEEKTFLFALDPR
jgi:alpha-glucosidase